MLPKDPMILLSVVNTKLRDENPSLDALGGALDEDREELEKRLAAVGFAYDAARNAFH